MFFLFVCLEYVVKLQVRGFLAMTTTEGFMPRGAVDFERISDNILEESAVSDDVLRYDYLFFSLRE